MFCGRRVGAGFENGLLFARGAEPILDDEVGAVFEAEVGLRLGTLFFD
jgi:hypothetical protein